MPSTYAHYKFGQEIRHKLTRKEKQIIDEFPDYFNIGLHGPDILFYYKPLRSNSVNQIGYSTHDKSGLIFFENAAKILKLHPQDNRYYSYLYGVICHFALDTTCHGYIAEKIAKSGISHTEIEVEFDRALLIADGLNPITQPLTEHIKTSEEFGDVIHSFFPPVSGAEVITALKGMIHNNNLLIAPSHFKRSIIYLILFLSGNYKEMRGLIVNYHENPSCRDSTEMLMQLYQKAKITALALIREYEYSVNEDIPLNPIYQYNFAGNLIKEEIHL